MALRRSAALGFPMNFDLAEEKVIFFKIVLKSHFIVTLLVFRRLLYIFIKFNLPIIIGTKKRNHHEKN